MRQTPPKTEKAKPLTLLSDWKQALKNALTDPLELLEILCLKSDTLPSSLKAALSFPLRVPREFISRIEKGNPTDPLLLQILPLGAEILEVPGFTNDPLEEAHHNPLPGLLHKYQGRVLLITTSVCAVHCRYCFRRNFPYEDQYPSKASSLKILNYIQQDQSIREVIFSGGDPLSQTDSSLDYLLSGLKAIPHLETLRFHSRIPVVLPQRIDTDFVRLFKSVSFNKVMVIHVNHANELNSAVYKALQALKESGFTLLNQSVLLKGINDDLNAQVALQKKLFSYGVLPYYLHLLDRARGTAHFEVSREAAQRLHTEMTLALPGYLVPRLVSEIPGKGSKTLIHSASHSD